MKYTFERFFVKLLCILFLSSTTTPPIASKPIIPAIAAVELAVVTAETALVAAEATAAIAYALTLYAQSEIHEQKGLTFETPEVAGIQIANIPLTGRSDEEVVATIAQQVTNAIAIKNSLNTSEKGQLWNAVQLHYPQHIQSLQRSRSVTHRQFHAHFQAITNTIQQANRLKGATLTEKAISDFFEANARAHHPDNEANTQRTFRGIIDLFIDCNSANIARRIEARIWLSHVSHCDPRVFGYQIKKAALNLQERYFDRKNNLVHLTYDARLPETIKEILQDSPYNFSQKDLEQLYERVQENNLDPGNAFEEMHQRDTAGGVSGWEKLWRCNKSYEKSKIKRPFFLFRHGDRRKKIFENPNNHRLYTIGCLAENADFKIASQLAQTNVETLVIRVCRQKLCDQFGILQKYQYIPQWQNLPIEQKAHIGRHIYLQDKMNDALEIEWSKLNQDSIVLRASSTSQSTSISSPGAPPQMPEDDPKKEDEKDDGNHENNNNGLQKDISPCNTAYYEKLKYEYKKEQITSVTKTTEHGLERLIERDFCGEEVYEILTNPTTRAIQKDKGTIFIKQFGNETVERFHYIVRNTSDEVVTGMKNLDSRAVKNLLKKYTQGAL